MSLNPQFTGGSFILAGAYRTITAGSKLLPACLMPVVWLCNFASLVHGPSLGRGNGLISPSDFRSHIYLRNHEIGLILYEALCTRLIVEFTIGARLFRQRVSLNRLTRCQRVPIDAHVKFLFSPLTKFRIGPVSDPYRSTIQENSEITTLMPGICYHQQAVTI